MNTPKDDKKNAENAKDLQNSKKAKKDKKDTLAMEVPGFLADLLNSRSPSGFEFEAQSVIEKHAKTFADSCESDILGNRTIFVNKNKRPRLMFSGHMDELGFIISYIDDQGYIYFECIGGHDLSLISGRRIAILTDNGVVYGVTGRKAIHQMTSDERKKVPEMHKLWIDIGVSSKKEALELVKIGDPAVYDDSFKLINKNMISGRGLDNRVGCYVAIETVRRLHKEKFNKFGLVALSSTQEEVGVRGATPAAFTISPDVAIVIDVGHATDYPDQEKTKFGEIKIGSGPIIARGANVNHKLFNLLKTTGEKEKIPFQIQSDPGSTGTDARVIQLSKEGIATALVSVPIRYMHTCVETMDLVDLENTVKLLVAFAKKLDQAENFAW